MALPSFTAAAFLPVHIVSVTPILPGSLSSPNYIVYFFLPNLFFFIIEFLGVVAKDHRAEPVLDCLEISSTKEIIPLLLSLVSGKF